MYIFCRHSLTPSRVPSLCRSTSTSPLEAIEMDATKKIKFLSYNVWSREDVVVYKRMQAIGALVEQHDPDVIFFQEVTPYIRSIFEDLAWWNKYHCSPVFPDEQASKQPFCLLLSKFPLENFARRKLPTSPTDRFYLEADICPDPATMKPIRVATTQLERPRPPFRMLCMERYAQAEHVVAALGSSAENVVFGGDMCWRDDTDRPFPLPAGWLDAWPAWITRQGFSGIWFSSWTYDGAWEEKSGVVNDYAAPTGSMKKRSDRFVCKMEDYSINAMELIEDTDQKAVRCYKRLKRDYIVDYDSFSSESNPLWPSCHRGLILTIVPNDPPRPGVPLAPAPPPPPAHDGFHKQQQVFGKPASQN